MRPVRLPVGPGQESVWDYPRPPRLEPVAFAHRDRLRRAEDRLDARRIPRPRNQPSANVLHPARRHRCRSVLQEPGEFKRLRMERQCDGVGRCRRWQASGTRGLVVREAQRRPSQRLPPLSHFMLVAMDVCTVDGERVTPQPGGFYGGWVTSQDRGPDQGCPGHDGLVERPKVKVWRSY